MLVGEFRNRIRDIAIVFVVLCCAGGCIPFERASFADAEDNVVSRKTDLILEEISNQSTESTAKSLPLSRDPLHYISAADMRIGLLYTFNTATDIVAKLTECTEDYRRYILGIQHLDAVPLSEFVHHSLSGRIKEMRGLEYPPTTTRIGKEDINTTKSVAFLPILIQTEQGYSTGELECRWRDTSWSLYNFVVDVSQLINADAEISTRFDPLLF